MIGIIISIAGVVILISAVALIRRNLREVREDPGIVAARKVARARMTWPHLAAAYDALGKPSMGEGTVTGEMNGFRIWIGEMDESKTVWLLLSGVEREIPQDLRLLFRAGVLFCPGKERPTGDGDFDRAVKVDGDDDTVFALLGHEARAALVEACKGDWMAVSGGNMNVHLLTADLRKRDVAAWIEEATRLAAHLTLPEGGTKPALVHNALTDPCPRIRENAFAALVHSFPDTAEALATARELLGDSDDGVRLLAAASLGTEALDTLAALVRESFSTHTAEPKRTERPAEGDELPATVVAELSPEEREARAGIQARALQLLVERSPAAAVRPLVREAVCGKDSGLRLAALRALAVVGDEACESAALGALDAANDEVRLAAVEALSSIGSPAAVTALRALAERSGLLDFELRRAVDNAVAKIQARIPGAAAGQVTLAGDEGSSAAGRVSLAADALAGTVALAPGEQEKS